MEIGLQPLSAAAPTCCNSCAMNKRASSNSYSTFKSTYRSTPRADCLHGEVKGVSLPVNNCPCHPVHGFVRCFREVQSHTLVMTCCIQTQTCYSTECHKQQGALQTCGFPTTVQDPVAPEKKLQCLHSLVVFGPVSKYCEDICWLK